MDKKEKVVEQTTNEQNLTNGKASLENIILVAKEREEELNKFLKLREENKKLIAKIIRERKKYEKKSVPKKIVEK